MKGILKKLSISLILILSMPLLVCCEGTSKSSVKIDEVAKCYIDTYLRKDDVEYNKSGINKDKVEALVSKRDAALINSIARKDDSEVELLKAYYEGLDKVEYKINSSSKEDEKGKVNISITGIDISKIDKEAVEETAKLRKEKKMTAKEINEQIENIEKEKIKNPVETVENDIDIEFVKDSEGDWTLSEDSIKILEQAISYRDTLYAQYTDDISEKFTNAINEAK